jgi:hypothetical protein
MSVNTSMVLPTVKKLAILVGFANGNKCSLLLEVLRCFPCLETLYIKVQPSYSVRLSSNIGDALFLYEVQTPAFSVVAYWSWCSLGSSAMPLQGISNGLIRHLCSNLMFESCVL